MPNERVVIAEDDALALEDIKQRVESLGYEVPGTAPEARAAIALARTCQPDVVLMDIQLPGDMDGIQAAEQIRVLEIPVIFVTGLWEGAVFERAKLAEPCGYVLKPFETRDLKTSLELGLYRHRVERERHRLLHHLQHAPGKSPPRLGRLSICSYCKRIGENREHWTQIEAYLMERIDVSFTHGICPGCFERVKRQLDRTADGSIPDGSLVLG